MTVGDETALEDGAPPTRRASRRRQVATRLVVVAGIVLGLLAPAAMVRHGWQVVESSRGVGRVHGVFTAATCDRSAPMTDTGHVDVTCRGSFDSASVHLPSVQVQPAHDLKIGVPGPAYLAGGEVGIPDDRDAALGMGLWAAFAFVVALFEAAVLSALVAAARGCAPRMIMRLVTAFVVGIPGTFVALVLGAVGCLIGFAL